VSSPIDAIERRLTSWSPASRRRWAVHILVWSLIAGIVNVVLFAVGLVTVDHLILITLMLSWLAITITAADLVATTDVREEAVVEEESRPPQ
jgi:hypothetical protein